MVFEERVTYPFMHDKGVFLSNLRTILEGIWDRTAVLAAGTAYYTLF